MARPKLLIAASGTGGHLFPALAVAAALPDYEIHWLGVPDRLETKLVPEHYPLHQVSLKGFQGRNPLAQLRPLGQLLGAIQKTRTLIRRQGIQGVFTTGGYIAAPGILAARSLGCPALLHESNALPGKVTRALAPWCTQVAVGMADAVNHLGQKKGKTTIVVTGTPVRPEFLTPQSLDLDIPADCKLVVAMGGSQGAVALNQIVRAAAPGWLEAGYWVVHLTGTHDPDAHSLNHPHYRGLPFYDNMAGLLQRADVAISRAGASALTELTFTGTPSLLIPYPYAAEDHQRYNAEVLVKAGAAEMIRQADLTGDRLQQLILDWLGDSGTLKNMASQARSLAVPDSTEQLAALLRQLIPPNSL